MKKIGSGQGILVLIYVVGGISGAVYHSMTTGAVDRARIAALDGMLKERNEKLEKCTTALIEGLHPTATAPPRKDQISQKGCIGFMNALIFFALWFCYLRSCLGETVHALSK